MTTILFKPRKAGSVVRIFSVAESLCSPASIFLASVTAAFAVHQARTPRTIPSLVASASRGAPSTVHREGRMIRKLKSGEYRLYSRKKNPKTGKRRNLGTFKTRAAAAKHEKAVQFFKRGG